MLDPLVGADDHRNPPATFDEDENTVMVPTFSEGSFFADRYRIESTLGSGAMGRVYEAVELHSGRRVALKVLHKERLGEEDTVARFKREAEVLASIGHPCIVDIYTFHHTPDGTPYLAMELLEGVTLKTRLQNAGRFEDPRDFQEVVDGIAGALSAAHAHGVVHRDMKPDNIFLLATGEPRAKLVDFGLSRLAKADKSLTRSGMILGTPRYMAPEQIRDASSAGPSVDIYSLGVIVFESLTGQSPYPAEDYGQLLGCVMEGRTTPLEEIRPELAAIGAVVRRALNPDQSARFSSCDELADAYAQAVGVPSKRHELAARPASKPQRRERVSSGSIPVNKGSTLAFDVAALGGKLPELPDAAPPVEPAPLAPPPPAWELEGRGSPSAEALGTAPTVGADDVPCPPAPLTATPAATPAHSAPPAPAQPEGSQPFRPAPSPAVQSQPAPPQPSAQGGDTLFLDQPVGGPGSMPSGPPPPMPHAAGPVTPAPLAPSGPPPRGFSSSGASPALVSPALQPGAKPKKKKRGCGLVAFLVAMVVVVVLSAAGGFALRAYTRGELELPFELPIEAAADEGATDDGS